MQILGNIFNAIIFVSAIGGIFCVLSLFINHILRCTLPLWFPLCGMILFCVPFLSPDVFLISPETQEWLNGFYTACWVWVCGCGILFVYDTIRSIMAKRALKGYQICNTERLNALCLQCAEIVGLKKVPALYWGTLDNPICVTGAIRPAIIMSKTVIEKLTDGELSAVFIHELTHIKRKHILLERIYDYVFSMQCIFLLLNTMIYFIAAPFEISLIECIVPLIKAIFVSLVPTSLFVSFCSIALPGMIDIRLFYILAAILFGFNATYVGSAEAMPFYLITSGDLVRLIWVHPRWPFVDMGSVIANGFFLVGSGLVFGCLLFLKHKFWRAE